MIIEGSRILVLGANGVLGSYISELLQSKGAQILGTARSNQSSVTLNANFSERLILDLNDPVSIAAVASYLVSSELPLDGVINAAGVVGFGTVEATSSQMAAMLMQVNHLGPAELVTQLLPVLKKSAEVGNTPIVVGITGVVAERAFPGMAAYVASKTAHAAWLSALALEIRRAKIRVLDAHPGHTETGLASRSVFGSAPKFPQGLTPEHVAQVIVTAIERDATSLTSADF